MVFDRMNKFCSRCGGTMMIEEGCTRCSRCSSTGCEQEYPGHNYTEEGHLLEPEPPKPIDSDEEFLIDDDVMELADDNR